MMDPVSMNRMAELNYQEYQAIADYERSAKPLRISLTEAANKVIARFMAATHTAPVETTREITAEPCVEC